MSYYSINSPRIIFENVVNETLIIDTLTGSYFSLEETGSQIWQLIDQKIDEKQIAQHLSQTWQTDINQVSKDLTILLKDLADNHLIIPAGKPERVSEIQSQPNTKTSYINPKLNKFTDLQDLLLIDPIHDINWNDRAK